MAVSNNLAQTEFMPYITKYVIEVVLVVFSFTLAASQFLLQDATHAVATLSLFMAAGMRIAPAVMRIQQASVQLVGSLANSSTTLGILRDFPNGLELLEEKNYVPEIDHNQTLIECINLSFTYNGNSKPTLENINISLKSGNLMAIVGPSGSGKSTLVDLIMGMLTPKEGEVLINGIPVFEFIQRYPGQIGYVPQKIFLLAGSIQENIGLGLEKSEIDSKRVWECLKFVQMFDFVHSLPKQEHENIGDNGVSLSGGQLQRLGLARALYTNPRIIILDEATSALDPETERLISEVISSFKGSKTIIVIAHREQSLRVADKLVLMENGKVGLVSTEIDVDNDQFLTILTKSRFSIEE
jgi:ABC-type multidrug transport system fused ATPase/permease subunit